MAEFYRLPTEIWALIASKADQRSLLDLACTSKWYRELATPELYHHMMYWNSEATSTEVLRGKNIECLSKEDASCLRSTRIFDLTALTKILSESSYLRSMIVSVDFTWDYAIDETHLYGLLEILISSSLRHLHLSPAHVRFAVPPGTPVTSLVLRLDYEHDSDEFNELNELSRLPSLRHICFEEWDFFEHPSLHLADYICATITPNITHLTIHLCDLPTAYLHAIVSKPAKLRSFKYSSREEYTTLSSSVELLESALKIHQRTLEEVAISIPFSEGKLP